jgi:hypothetical protein
MRSARRWITIGALTALSAGPAMAQTAGNGAQQLVTMKSDLRRLVGANEVYHAKNRRYASDLTSLQGFKASLDVTIVFVGASAGGWAATATSSGAPGKSCTIWVGTVSPHPATATLGLTGAEAVPMCDRP